MNHVGIIGVDVGWLESIVPGIEEIAAALPEPVAPCPECGGTGWRNVPLRMGKYEAFGGALVRCDCETGGEA